MWKLVGATCLAMLLCISAAVAQDAYEPDDSYPYATPIDLNSAQLNHSINPVGDDDWVSFSLTQATSIVLLTHGAGTDDAYLELYGANGAPLIASDNDSGHGMFSRIETTLAAGTYTARVQDDGDNSIIGNYLIALYSQAVDSWENDDVTSRAVALQSDVPQENHSIFPSGDVDYTTFTLNARAHVLLETSGAYGSHTILDIYPAGSTTPVASDNTTGYDAFSTIDTTLDAGAYTARVSSDGTVPQYTIALTVTEADAYECDDSVSSATVLTSGIPQTGHTLFPETDVDWTSFTLTALSTVILETSGDSGNTEMWLYESDGATQIAHDDSSGVGDFSRIETTLDPGVYAVKVAENGNNAVVRDYTLSLEAISGDAYECDDSVTSATPLVAGTVQTSHTIWPVNDEDWVVFTISQESWIYLEATGPVHLTLAQADGATPIRTKSADGEEFAAITHVLAPGSYTARVKAETSSDVLGPYSIRFLAGAVAANPLASYGVGAVHCAAWSPATSSSQIATSYASGIHLWDADTGELQRTLAYTTDSGSEALAFSPDGNYVLGSGPSNNALVWDLTSGSVSRVLGNHDSNVYAVAWSPDGSMMLTGSGYARLWDAATGNQLRVFDEHTDIIRSVAFSPDSTRIATASDDHTVKIWNVASTISLRTFDQHADDVNAIAWSPDGTLMASGGDDDDLYLWDPASGVVSQQHLDIETENINAIAFSPDSQRLLIGWESGHVRLYYIPTWTLLYVFEEHTGRIESVAFSPDGAHALIAGVDQKVSIRNTVTGALERNLNGHAEYVFNAVVDHSNAQAVAVGLSPSVTLWDIDSAEMLRTFEGHTQYAICAAFSPDDSRFVTGSMDTTARVWNAATGVAELLLVGHTNGVWGVAWSPDGAWIATASTDGTARLWDATTGASLQTFSGHSADVFAVAFTADSAFLLTGSKDGTVRVWDAATGSQQQTLAWGEAIQCLAVSPDGSQGAAGSTEGKAFIWNIATGTPVRTLTGPDSTIRTLAFTQDGKRIVTAGDSEGILWNLESGDIETVFYNGTDSLYSAALAHNDTRLVTAGADTRSLLWDTGLLPPTAFNLEQSVSVASDGHFWAMVFDYSSGQTLATLDAEMSGTLDFDMETDHWCGVYLYDYTSGAYSRGFYGLRQSMNP